MVAEVGSVARKHRLGNLQGDASERHESNFDNRTCCLRSKQQTLTSRPPRDFIFVPRMSTEPDNFNLKWLDVRSWYYYYY
jgi:hypothetical protein